MTIDEAIAQEILFSKEDFYKRKEYHEQLAEWLEELKGYRAVTQKNLQEQYILGCEDGYNKAIDDAKDVILQSLDNEILVDTLNLRLEQLKAGGENDKKRTV